jgi:hypothetical protein
MIPNSSDTRVVMKVPSTGDVAAIFPSINVASRALGVNRKYIARAVHDGDSARPNKVTCGGYLWDIADNIMGDAQTLQTLYIERAKEIIANKKSSK